MIFEGAGYTNVGTVKESNQDGYLIKIAETPLGDVALIAVADGMGGLDKGELASATAIRVLSNWFDEKLPPLLEAMDSSVGGFETFVEGQWSGLVQELNLRIMRYGAKHGISLGTTLTAMLVMGARYSIIHVGDSRAYEVTDEKCLQLTEDQTFVKREVEAGRMTPQEALTHPQRNVLLQCIGASKEVHPDVIRGNLHRGATYVLCSDGFRHVISDDDMQEAFSPSSLSAAQAAEAPQWEDRTANARESALSRVLARMGGVVMERGEHDNLTAVLLRVKGDER